MQSLSELVDQVRTYQPGADVDLIARAYAYGEKAHQGQTRKSGDPYFSHPASVAGVITSLKLDTASVCAGLLHDVVEDTLATTTDIEREFGQEVAFLVDGVISWKVRNTVVSEGTEVNRSSWRRRCSMSAQLSPPPASIRHDCTRTLPRSCNGVRSPFHGMRDDSASPSPNRSAKDPRACSPTWATTPAPPGSTMTRRALVPFTLEVPFWKRKLLIRDLQFPLLGGHIRGRGWISSAGLVNGQG